MPFLETRGVRIHYQFDPTPNRPVLVFSNSLGTDFSMWDTQLDAFRGSFSLLRFDTRGHGQSSVPATPYTIADAAQDVLALLDHLGIQQAVFCGLSFGGIIGQWLAIHAVERFSSFVLCNSAAKIGTPETWNQRIATVTAQGMATIVPAVLERWYTPHFRAQHPEVLARTSAMLLHTHPQGYTLACAAIRDIDLRHRIGEIDTPTLIVYGDEDPVTTPADAQFLRDHIPNAESLCLPAAHLSNIEAANAFNDGVLRFLQKIEGILHHG